MLRNTDMEPIIYAISPEKAFPYLELPPAGIEQADISRQEFYSL